LTKIEGDRVRAHADGFAAGVPFFTCEAKPWPTPAHPECQRAAGARHFATLRFALQLGEEFIRANLSFSSSRAARVISRQQEKAAVCVSDPPPAAESRGASKKRTGTVKNIRAFGSSPSLHDPRAAPSLRASGQPARSFASHCSWVKSSTSDILLLFFTRGVRDQHGSGRSGGVRP